MCSRHSRGANVVVALGLIAACTGREPVVAPGERPQHIWGGGGPCEKYTTISVFVGQCYALQGLTNPYNPYSDPLNECPPGFCVSTFPFGGDELTKLNDALNSMSSHGGQCAQGAGLVALLMADSKVSWWQPQDTQPNGTLCTELRGPRRQVTCFRSWLSTSGVACSASRPATFSGLWHTRPTTS
jgi:hypothetical protein